MKRFISLIVVLLLIFGVFCTSALAEFDPESISTPYICLMDGSTGAVLYQRAASDHSYPASTTKIMTAILAIENTPDLNSMVTVSEDVETRGSQMNVVRGEELRMIDLLYGMMLHSGNDAAQQIAIAISGSESAFAELMNAKAAELGMVNTYFVKPNGLHKDEHYCSAYDMALLTRYCLKNETFRTIVGTEKYNVPPTTKDSDGYQLQNSNKLITTKEDEVSYEYRYAIGVKTGDTDQAGRCLVAAAEKDGVQLILVLFGDYSYKVDKDYRYTTATAFFDWGFENYSSLSATELGLESTMILPVSNASFEDAEGGNLTINIDLSAATISGTKEDIAAIQADPSLITSEYTLTKTLSAPIAEGEELGEIEYRYNGTPLFTTKLYASRAVAEIGSSTDGGPSPSPLLVGGDEDEASSGSGWLFWVLIGLGVLLILVLIRLIMMRRPSRRRSVRRRRRRR